LRWAFFVRLHSYSPGRFDESSLVTPRRSHASRATRRAMTHRETRPILLALSGAQRLPESGVAPTRCPRSLE
jgi:hypothetical protein